MSALYNHAVVKHGQGEYVVGDAHTNGIENFWSHFKRMIVGTYFHMTDVHMDAYIQEEMFRYNLRDFTEGQRMAVAVYGAQGKRLTWNDLVSKNAA